MKGNFLLRVNSCYKSVVQNLLVVVKIHGFEIAAIRDTLEEHVRASNRWNVCVPVQIALKVTTERVTVVSRAVRIWTSLTLFRYIGIFPL